jgi:protein SCO1/2
MKWLSSTATCCLLGLGALTLMVSCASHGPEQRYGLKGKVVFVDKRGGTVSISHEAIPGYMEAMTMPFTLKDPRLLSGLADGDSIQATLVVSGSRSWLEDVITTRLTPVADGAVGATPSPDPVVGSEVPDLSFTNQSAKRITLSQYRGGALVVTFIYTRCPLPDYCPLMTANFSDVAKELKEHPDNYPQTRLLSITVDPDYDTPRVLREYGSATGADFKQWEFATGTREEVKRAAIWFGMTYWTEGDQIIHSLRTAVIGPDGRLVKLFAGNEWKPAEVLSELRAIKPASAAR